MPRVRSSLFTPGVDVIIVAKSRPFGMRSITSRCAHQRQQVVVAGVHRASPSEVERIQRRISRCHRWRRPRDHEERLSGDQAPTVQLFWGAAYPLPNGQRVQGPYGYYNIEELYTQGNIHANSLGLFVQDAWTVNNRLTLNIGIRAENQDVPSYSISRSESPSSPPPTGTRSTSRMPCFSPASIRRASRPRLAASDPTRATAWRTRCSRDALSCCTHA
jgi:hypothetical protein